MASRYSAGAQDSSEEVHLMNEDEKVTSSPSRLNRKSLVVFFGVIVAAAAIVTAAVMLTLYSGKKSFLLLFDHCKIIKVLNMFLSFDINTAVNYGDRGQLVLEHFWCFYLELIVKASK